MPVNPPEEPAITRSDELPAPADMPQVLPGAGSPVPGVPGSPWHPSLAGRA